MSSQVATKSMRRYAPAIVVTAVAAMVAGYLASVLATPLYTASATIQLADTDAFSDVVVDPERRVLQEANRVRSGTVFERAAEQLGADVIVNDLRDLRSQVVVTADPAVGLLVVSATAADPDVAAAMANAVTSSYEQASLDATAQQLDAKQQSVQMQAAELRSEIADLQSTAGASDVDAATARRRDTLRSQLDALEARDSEMTADAAAFGAGVDAVEQATPPSEPSSPRPLQNAAVAGVVGLVVAVAVAYWRASVGGREFDRGAMLDAPLLAEIPDFGRSVNGGAGESLFDVEAAEAYQFLLASFEHAIEKVHARSVLVTSATPGEGKSLTALHLARALASQGRDVILVDADIRARGLTSMLSAHDHPGFVALAEGENLDAVVRHYRIVDTVRLPVIPAGQPPAQPTGLLATTRYREAIRRLTVTRQLTIIDGSPLLTVADPLALASQVSGILLVVDADTPEDQLAKVRQRLHLIATPLIGYILNRARIDGANLYQYPSTAPPASGRHSEDPGNRPAPYAVSDPARWDG